MANTYPFKKYNYRVEIDSIDVAAFSEVSGVDASIDVIEYREGTDPINSPRKMPGMTKYGNVTLKWGMTENMSFYEWVAGISNGSKASAEDRMQDVTIHLQDDAHDDIASWTLKMRGRASTPARISTPPPARSRSRALSSRSRRCSATSKPFD